MKYRYEAALVAAQLSEVVWHFMEGYSEGGWRVLTEHRHLLILDPDEVGARDPDPAYCGRAVYYGTQSTWADYEAEYVSPTHAGDELPYCRACLRKWWEVNCGK